MSYEPRRIVRFASSHRNLIAVLKAGKMKSENEKGLTIPGDRIQFRDYMYEAEDPKEIAALMERVNKPGAAVKIECVGEEYQCTHPGCDATFPTKSQYDSHKGVHTREEKKAANE